MPQPWFMEATKWQQILVKKHIDWIQFTASLKKKVNPQKIDGDGDIKNTKHNWVIFDLWWYEFGRSQSRLLGVVTSNFGFSNLRYPDVLQQPSPHHFSDRPRTPAGVLAGGISWNLLANDKLSSQIEYGYGPHWHLCFNFILAILSLYIQHISISWE